MGPGRTFSRNILSLRKIVALSLLLLAFPACAPIAVSVKPDSGLGRTKTLKVFAEHGDPVGVKAILERLLVSKGFRLATRPEEKTDYVLRFGYVYLDGFRKFSAVVADTSNDDVIAVGDFEGYRIGDGLLEEFVSKLADQVR
jgi:hypothetical protein